VKPFNSAIQATEDLSCPPLLRPQFTDFLRQHVLDILDLAFGNTSFQYAEYCTGNPFRIDLKVSPQLFLNSC
jgi:hypothetical protein